MTNQQLGAVLHHLLQTAARRHEDDLPDEILLERFARQREESAFAALLRRHGPMVLNVCRGILRQGHDVEDAFQATFLVLAQKAVSIRRGQSVGGWLHKVASNIALKARTKTARAAVGQAFQPDERTTPNLVQADPLDDLTVRELREALHEELRQLPEKYRLPLILCYLEGQTQEEAARHLGWPKRRVKDRLQRGRERLRRRLSQRGLAPAAVLGTSLFVVESVSAALVSGTVRSVVQAAPLSPAVAALVEAGGAMLFFSKAKVATALLLAVSLLGGAGVWAYRGLTAARPVASAHPSVAKADDKPKDPSHKPEKGKSMEIQGRVLGPDAKAVAGAKVYYYFLTHQEEALPVRATTDAQGRFAFTLTPKDIPLSADAEHADPRKMGQVIVKADGFTFAWHGVAKQHRNLTLHVAADSTPLTGRLIDLQGKPLAGLRVTAWSVAAPETGDLAPFVKALRSRESFNAAYRKHLPHRLWNPFIWSPRIPLLPATTTDVNGRFRLRGLAKEQLVQLRIEGAAIQTQNLFVMTRPIPREDAALLSAPRFKHRPEFGPSERVVVLANGFDYPLPPGLTVAGSVRDEETKKPIARAIVESYRLAGADLPQNGIYHTVADEQGRYRFTGLPRGKGNRIRIRPPGDRPYIPIVMEVPVPVVKDVPAVKSFDEATVDVTLTRGVWVDVTVADKSTGRPVPGSVSYFVLPEKPSPQRPFDRPFADSYDDVMPIANDGTFRFVAVPRRAIVAVRADWEKYPIAPEAATIRLHSGLSAANFQAFAEINPKLDEEPIKLNIALDAGCIVKGKIVDPQGQPLSGVVAAALRHDWYWREDIPLKTAEFTVLGLRPDRPRLLCFVHEEKKLAGSVVVRGDEKAPLTVKLQPWASVSGRLFDAKGKPVPNATLWFTEIPVRRPGQPMSLDTGLHVFSRWVRRLGMMPPDKPDPDPRTDEQGRFRIDHLVPGLKYNLALVDDRGGAARFEQIKWQGLVFAQLILKPGEAKELGDVKLQPFPDREK